MSTYFERHPQRYTQWRRVRRNGGHTAPQITVHTYEAPAGRSAEAGAKYLLTRNTPGSYHWLAGPASERDGIQLAPWSAETWHSVPSNNWAIGVSAMAHASEWKRLDATLRRNLVHSMAYGAHLASRWYQRTYGRPIPAKRINRAQAMRKEAGFISHGEMDPGRRTDPGKDFPWDMFFAEYTRLEGTDHGVAGITIPTIPKGHLDMHPDELNRHLSRHAENIVAQLTKNVDDVVRQRDNIQNTALHGAFKRELAVLLDGGLEDAVVAAVNAQPDRDAREIAQAVVAEVGRKFVSIDKEN